MKERKKVVSIVSFTLIVALLITASYAYFKAQSNGSSSTDINVTTATVDSLTFETGDAISIKATQDNFASGLASLSDDTYASATLVANNDTYSASANYYLYLSISSNDFEYTTSDSTPELILIITDSNGDVLESLDGLEYTTVTDNTGEVISGFDITTKTGLITIASNYLIESSGIETQKWNIEVIFVNLSTNQSSNADKSLNAQVLIQQEKLVYTLSNAMLLNSTSQTSVDNAISLIESKSATYSSTSPVGSISGYTDDMKSNIESSTGSSYYITTSRYITYADSYTFNEETGTYTLENPSVGRYSSVYSQLSGKYIVSYSGSTSSSTATYTNLSTIYYVTDSTTSSKIYYIASSKTTNYSYDYTETGLYAIKDDYGTSYYYRGDVDDNYVYFAGFYWRIIRRNGDGSVRLIYDGINIHKNGDSDTDRYYTTSKYNTSYSNNAYVGYMYGNNLYSDNGITSNTSTESRSTWLYGSGYTFNESTGTYTLTGTSKKALSSDLAGLYTCGDNSTTSCSTLYYVMSVDVVNEFLYVKKLYSDMYFPVEAEPYDQYTISVGSGNYYYSTSYEEDFYYGTVRLSGTVISSEWDDSVEGYYTFFSSSIYGYFNEYLYEIVSYVDENTALVNSYYIISSCLYEETEVGYTYLYPDVDSIFKPA